MVLSTHSNATRRHLAVFLLSMDGQPTLPPIRGADGTLAMRSWHCEPKFVILVNRRPGGYPYLLPPCYGVLTHVQYSTVGCCTFSHLRGGNWRCVGNTVFHATLPRALSDARLERHMLNLWAAPIR